GNKFDNFVNNDYSGVTSVKGGGGVTLSANITFLDPNFFVDSAFGGLGSTIKVTLDANTSTVVPFDQANPSAKFSSTGNNGPLFNAAIGTTNGVSGPDFQFQADANASFDVTPVPAPSSLVLSLLGLGGLGTYARVRRLFRRAA